MINKQYWDGGVWEGRSYVSGCSMIRRPIASIQGFNTGYGTLEGCGDPIGKGDGSGDAMGYPISDHYISRENPDDADEDGYGGNDV